MIDEKTLIEDIGNMVKPLTTPDGCGIYDSEIRAYNEGLIDVMETVNEQPKVGEWTPCSEMLPSIDMSYPNAKDYLVYYEHGYYDVASYSNINRFWHGYTTEPYWNCQQYCKVVAWMPLPEPFKESED